MKDYISLFLDKKFPEEIKVTEHRKAQYPNLTVLLFSSGKKKLFMKVVGNEEFFYHFNEANPEQLQMWFELTKENAEEKIVDWANKRLKKQSS
jgi:hypothetical protein